MINSSLGRSLSLGMARPVVPQFVISATVRFSPRSTDDYSLYYPLRTPQSQYQADNAVTAYTR